MYDIGDKFIGIAEDYKVVDIVVGEESDGIDIIVEKQANEKLSKKSK